MRTIRFLLVGTTRAFGLASFAPPALFSSPGEGPARGQILFQTDFEGATLEVDAQEIREDLVAKRPAIRIALRLKEPLLDGAVAARITPGQ